MAANTSVKRLKDLYVVEHYRKLPSIPPQCRIAPKYSDKTANGLTKCIISWLKLSGWQAERINVMGRPIDRRKWVTDCIGRRKQIGSIQWIPSGSQRGSSDISSTIASSDAINNPKRKRNIKEKSRLPVVSISSQRILKVS